MFPSYRNQSVELTGFYVIETLVVKELIESISILFTYLKQQNIERGTYLQTGTPYECLPQVICAN